MNFQELFNRYNWDELQKQIYSQTDEQVRLALAKKERTLDDFMALISPAAQPYLGANG